MTGQPHQSGALDAALKYIRSHAGVWRATGWEIVQHFLALQPKQAVAATLQARHPEPAECRQLQRRPDRVNSKTKVEQVHLEALAGGDQDTEEPIKR